MSTIGGYTVLTLTGPQIVPTAETVEDISRAAQDGHAYRTMGKRAPAVQVRTFMDFATATSAQTIVASYRALQGTLITVVDDHSVTTTSVMVEAVENIQIRRVAKSAGGTANATQTVTALWTLRAISA